MRVVDAINALSEHEGSATLEIEGDKLLVNGKECPVRHQPRAQLPKEERKVKKGKAAK